MHFNDLPENLDDTRIKMYAGDKNYDTRTIDKITNSYNYKQP